MESRYDVHGAARVLQRTLAHYHLWKDHPLANSLGDQRTSLLERKKAGRAALRPPPLSQKAHLAALHCVGGRALLRLWHCQVLCCGLYN
jgi:hypothetical protein